MPHEISIIPFAERIPASDPLTTLQPLFPKFPNGGELLAARDSISDIINRQNDPKVYKAAMLHVSMAHSEMDPAEVGARNRLAGWYHEISERAFPGGRQSRFGSYRMRLSLVGSVIRGTESTLRSVTWKDPVISDSLRKIGMQRLEGAIDTSRYYRARALAARSMPSDSSPPRRANRRNRSLACFSAPPKLVPTHFPDGTKVHDVAPHVTAEYAKTKATMLEDVAEYAINDDPSFNETFQHRVGKLVALHQMMRDAGRAVPLNSTSYFHTLCIGYEQALQTLRTSENAFAREAAASLVCEPNYQTPINLGWNLADAARADQIKIRLRDIVPA